MIFRKLLTRFFPILLALLILLLSCRGSEKEKTEIETPESEVPAVNYKEAEILFSRGSWNSTKNGYYDGTSDRSLSYLSTQRFTKTELPAGSVVTIGAGVECRIDKWVSFPTPTQDGATVIGGNERTEITVTEDWWGDYASCAFSLSCAGDGTEAILGGGFVIRVPEETPDRRTYHWNDDGVLSILTVGNSFSDDAMEWVYQIAESMGVGKIRLGNLFYGGCRLEWHYTYWTEGQACYDYRENTAGHWRTRSGSTFEAAFRYRDWDFISFQESAQEIQSTKTLYRHLPDLIKMAKELCPNARIVWHQPWANPHTNYGNSTQAMYDDCMYALRLILEKYPFDEIITTGTAIQNARALGLKNSDLVRDGWHLSLTLGRYIAGLTFFSQITGISVEEITFAPAGVTEEQQRLAVEAAMCTVKHPRLVTAGTGENAG